MKGIPMNSHRKAQIQTSETIAVLFIFFVLILFGIIFYYKYQQVAIRERGEELLSLRAMDTTLKVLFLPELICSKGEAEPEDNCVDLLKVRYANETMHQHLEDYYFDLFSYSTISIHQLYPDQHTYIIYDKPKPSFMRKESTFFVVSVRDDTRGGSNPQYGFGYVQVEAYS